jgi:hypothetical protein
VFVALGQVPAIASLVAGSVLIASLAAHEIIPLCAAKSKMVATTSIASAKSTDPPDSLAGGHVDEGRAMLSIELAETVKV